MALVLINMLEYFQNRTPCSRNHVDLTDFYISVPFDHKVNHFISMIQFLF